MPKTYKLHPGTKQGFLKLGDMEIPCAVLEDGTRVLSQRAFTKTIGAPQGGHAFNKRRQEQGVASLPIFVANERLKPFIDADLEASLISPYEYQPEHGGRSALGIKAELVPKVCDVWLKARDEGVLTEHQRRIAKRAEMLVRGLAHVGITALVDEATDYQGIRDRDALQALLDKYLRKELAEWAKTFPDEFYEQMFRLRGWQWKGMRVNRPQAVANYTRDLVYERLAPDLLRKLEDLNPKNEKGYRPAKYFQWLTDDIGHPALTRHLYALVGFMRASTSWDQFYRLVQRAFPRKGTTLDLPYPDNNQQ
jgi:hypothetical protein